MDMDTNSTPVELAERVATVARELKIETVLIGAFALAIYSLFRASSDIDLATWVQWQELTRLRDALSNSGLKTNLSAPDDQDPLGGVLQVWEFEDENGSPFEPVEVVNYLNPYHFKRNPASQAIRNGIVMAEKPSLRYPRLGDLIALKFFTGGDEDLVDIVKVLAENLGSDLEEVRSICKGYGYERIDEMIEKAKASAARR
jgi:hypothetical protein